ncbi:MAG: hypothetical protein KatS3mg079_312 [Caloramator sp.]|nr:MAG: hypothetical protein KatS3mg079_312 [Caloramator sp.]
MIMTNILIFMLDKLQLKRKINDINSMVLDASMGFMLFATYDSKELINIIIDRIKRQDDTIKIHYIYFIILTLALYKFKEKFISLISDFLCLINISIYELEDIINIIKLTFDCGGNNNMFKTQIAKDYYETYIKDAKEIEFFFWIPNIFGE